MGKLGEQITVVVMAIVGVATLAVIVSRNSNTSNVLTAAGSGFDKILGAALSPVAGNAAINY
jgi:membrane DNA delivery protein